ncbi:MAG: universal stress protein [Candidatus Methanomethylophilaceae archaeon]|nr:universal stress protein [Candidatus Methanomethylophilaceae archaeon]MDD3379147.1 universal stress protein [Candidatus Methanomethylophilaceae archaeon]MDY0224325.1 universal stress protein [Candidatus Methanomethylophilaceae archaeon]
MSFKNILIPVDGNELTNAAIDQGVALAKLANGKITALYVVESKKKLTSALSATEYILEKCKDEGVEVTELIENGIPAQVILKKSSDYDVIVMGTAGKKGMTKLIVGSVAESVIRSSMCPVIVVRSPEVD